MVIVSASETSQLSVVRSPRLIFVGLAAKELIVGGAVSGVAVVSSLTTVTQPAVELTKTASHMAISATYHLHFIILTPFLAL
jgi:hypothetical protein